MTTEQQSFEDENAVKRHLSEWLTDHGNDVYWEQQNDTYDTFSVSNTGGEKPDLLIDGDRYTIAVEVKHNGSHANVYDAHPQTVRYWRDLTDAEYRIGDRQLFINGVVTATQTSPDGHLFKQPDDSPLDHYGDRREDVIERGALPVIEHAMTEQFVRLLWRWRKVSNQQPDGRYIGALLSGYLDGHGHKTPKVLWSNIPHDSWEVIK